MFWAVWGFLRCLMILGILERSFFFISAKNSGHSEKILKIEIWARWGQF
jgi:hypothetical protein